MSKTLEESLEERLEDPEFRTEYEALEKELDFETVKENLKYRNAGGW